MIKVNIIILSILVLVLLSCNRNDLCYDHPHGGLVVSTDWSLLYDPDYAPEGVRISLYNINSGVENTSYRPAEGGTIVTGDGEYNLLVVNSDTEVIQFRNMEKFESAEAYLPTVNSDIGQVVPIPDLHLVTSTSRHILTHRSKRSSDTITVSPQIRLKGLSLEVKLIRSEKCVAARGYLTGVAQSMNLSTSDLTGPPCTMLFHLTKDGNNYKVLTQFFGFIPPSTSTTTKGEECSKQVLTLEFKLINNTIYKVEINVTNQIDFDSPKIIIPISVAEIELPDVSAEGGFDGDIGNWDDEVIIPIENNKK